MDKTTSKASAAVIKEEIESGYFGINFGGPTSEFFNVEDESLKAVKLRRADTYGETFPVWIPKSGLCGYEWNYGTDDNGRAIVCRRIEAKAWLVRSIRESKPWKQKAVGLMAF